LIGGLREEASAEVGDHASGDCSLRGFGMGGADCAVKEYLSVDLTIIRIALIVKRVLN
jgi:hypothetical protein